MELKKTIKAKLALLAVLFLQGCAALLPAYTNSSEEQVAKIRVNYNYASALIKVGDQGLMRIPEGKTVPHNGSYLNGYRQLGISLGMPGQKPEFNFTEVIVPANVPAEISFYWTERYGNSISSCKPKKIINPKANKNYQVSYVMAGSACGVNVEELK